MHGGATTVAADPQWWTFVGVLALLAALWWAINWAVDRGVEDWLRNWFQ